MFGPVDLQTYRSLDIRHAGALIATGRRKLVAYHFFNHSAAIRYVKLYDTSGVPTVADVPIATVTVFAGQPGGLTLPGGAVYYNGIGVRCCLGIADNNAVDATAFDVSGLVYFV